MILTKQSQVPQLAQGELTICSISSFFGTKEFLLQLVNYIYKCKSQSRQDIAHCPHYRNLGILFLKILLRTSSEKTLFMKSILCLLLASQVSPLTDPLLDTILLLLSPYGIKCIFKKLFKVMRKGSPYSCSARNIFLKAQWNNTLLFSQYY